MSILDTSTFTSKDLEQRYEAFTASLHGSCTFTTELVGGQPADEKGVRAFVEHHLGIADPEEAEKAVHRILHEEIGARDATPEEGEVEEEEVYGVNVVRRDEYGPWIGDWMVKACIKAAASRLGLFSQKRGTKGDFAEAGRVRAAGISLLNPEHPERIYIRTSAGDGPAATSFRKFMGRVHTPQGDKSIVHHSECIAEGNRFEFEFRFPPGRVTKDQLLDVLAMATNIGLGSAKALERGKFRVDTCELLLPAPKPKA